LASLILLLAMFVLLWVLLIRPQRQRQVKQQQLLSSVEPGDEILTVGGLYGIVRDIDEEDDLIVEVAEGIQVRIARRAVGGVVKPEDEDKDDDGVVEDDELGVEEHHRAFPGVLLLDRLEQAGRELGEQELVAVDPPHLPRALPREGLDPPEGGARDALGGRLDGLVLAHDAARVADQRQLEPRRRALEDAGAEGRPAAAGGPWRTGDARQRCGHRSPRRAELRRDAAIATGSDRTGIPW